MTELLTNLQTAAPVLTTMFSSFAGVGIVAAIIAYCLERYPKAGAWADKLIGCDYPVDVKPCDDEVTYVPIKQGVVTRYSNEFPDGIEIQWFSAIEENNND